MKIYRMKLQFLFCPDQVNFSVHCIDKSFSRPLRKWWAQYMESIGEMEAALQFYESAQDNLSLVRVNCYCGNVTKVIMETL